MFWSHRSRFGHKSSITCLFVVNTECSEFAPRQKRMVWGHTLKERGIVIFAWFQCFVCFERPSCFGHILVLVLALCPVCFTRLGSAMCSVCFIPVECNVARGNFLLIFSQKPKQNNRTCQSDSYTRMLQMIPPKLTTKPLGNECLLRGYINAIPIPPLRPN